MADSGGGSVGGGPSGTVEHSLRRDVLGLPAITAQGVTHMAPAAGMMLSAPFIALFAGAAMSLAFGLALLISLIIAASIAQLAKHMPSAGGYYTYLSRGIGPKLGFLTGWTYFLYDPVIPALCSVIIGGYVQETLQTLYGFTFPWWLFCILMYAGLALVSYLGIKPSVITSIAFVSIEVVITLALSVTIFAQHGISGTALSQSFTPSGVPSPKFHGIFFALIFSVLSYTGFESTAPLAEETKDPRRNIKWAVLLSTVAVGIYYLIFGLATTIGYGPGNILNGKFASAANPYFTIANSAWGHVGTIIVLLALINSGWGCALAGQNAVVRVFYKMGQVGVLPSPLSRIHPRYRTPHVAIAVELLLSLGVGLGLGNWLGTVNTFGFLGAMITVGLIFVYGAGMVAVPIFYRREHPNEINVWLHYVLPFIGVVALIVVLYNSVYPPAAFPLNLPPYVDVVWFVIGLIGLWYLSRRRPEQLASGANTIFGEDDVQVAEGALPERS